MKTNFAPKQLLFAFSLILSLVALVGTPLSAMAQGCTAEVGSGLCPGNPPPRIDLASMCYDDPTTPAVIEFSWTYANSNPDGISCGFFDSDGDGNANYAACSRSNGTLETLFSCNDTHPSKCPGFVALSAPSLDCTASGANVSCSINVADLGGPETILNNVCSYTSNDDVDPNGTCKDCIIQGGSIRIDKTATDANGDLVPAGNPPMFSFTATSGSTVANASVLGSDLTSVAVPSGTYSVAETLPPGWQFDSVSCVNNSGSSVGTPQNGSITGVTLSSGQVVICDFANSEISGPSLHIEKLASVQSFTAAGQLIQYTYNVENTGNVDITNLAVHDDKICPNSTPCISCAVSTLPVGQSTTCGPADYTTTQADLDAGNVTNSAIASGTAGTAPVNSNVVQAVVVAIQSPDIDVVKNGVFIDGNGNGVANVGETIDYTVTVTNTGNITVTITSVSDPLLSNLLCVPALPAVLAPGGQVVCTDSYVLTMDDLDAEQVVNTATGCAEAPSLTDPLCRSSQVTVGLPFSDILQISKQGTFSDENQNGLADPGETIQYVLTLTNAGSRTLHNVTVSDPALGGTIQCLPTQPSTLAPGEAMACTGSYVITQADIDAGQKDNTATGDSDETDTVQASDSEPLPTLADFQIVKQGTFNDENQDGSAQPGETISYVITLTNMGNVTLTNVVVNDPIVGPVTCNPATPVAQLAPGDSISCTAAYAVTADDIAAGLKMNVASGSSSQVGPKTDDETVTLLAPTPTPTATATATATNTATATFTATFTATPTATFTATSTATPTLEPTSTASPNPTATPVPTEVPTLEPTVIVLGCNDVNITNQQTTIDGNALAQSRLAKTTAGRVTRLSNNKKLQSKMRSLITQAHDLYVKAWQVVWEVPSIQTQCQNTQFCVSVSNEGELSTLRSNSTSLRDIVAEAAKTLQSVGGPRNTVKRINRRNEELHQDNLRLIGTIPGARSVCTLP